MWFSPSTVTLLGEWRVRDKFNFLLPNWLALLPGGTCIMISLASGSQLGVASIFPRAGSSSRAVTPRARNWPFMSSQAVSVRAKSCFLQPTPVSTNTHPEAEARVPAWPRMPPLLSFRCHGGQRAKDFGIRPTGVFLLAWTLARLGMWLRFFRASIYISVKGKYDHLPQSLGKLNKNICTKIRSHMTKVNLLCLSLLENTPQKSQKQLNRGFIQSAQPNDRQEQRQCVPTKPSVARNAGIRQKWGGQSKTF